MKFRRSRRRFGSRRKSRRFGFRFGSYPEGSLVETTKGRGRVVKVFRNGWHHVLLKDGTILKIRTGQGLDQILSFVKSEVHDIESRLEKMSLNSQRVPRPMSPRKKR